MDEKEMSQIAEIVAKSVAAFKGDVSKTITGTPDAQLMFGSGGLFSRLGLDNPVVNLALSPVGIDRLLPVMSSNILNPIYSYITGIESDEKSEEPDGVCDDVPGGVIEACHQTAQFGRYSRGSKELEVNTLMQVVNGHLTTDLQLMGSLLGAGHALLPAITAGADKSNVLQSVIQVQLVIVGALLQRILSRQLWQGDPVNNTGGGGYKEFPGLDIQIATGKKDCFTNTACAALDPDIKDFNFNMVDSPDVDIVMYLTWISRWIRKVADGTGIAPVTWVIAMRPELFGELVEIWPCRYLTSRCVPATSNQQMGIVLNDSTNVTMRDQMRNGQYLLIDGVQWPVVLDDGIRELTAADNGNIAPGFYASDIYFLPLKIMGGFPVLYWETMDYSSAMADLSVLNGKEQFWATDGGRFMWTMQQKNYCFKFQGKLEPRVILRAPQVAGRLKNVKYSPMQHMPSPFEDSPYFRKGGVESVPAPSFFTDW
jgi:hypothetical protein